MKKIYLPFLLFLLLLTAGFELSAQTQIVLQPGATEGKDARVQSNIPNDNIGISQLFKAHSGTIGGVPFIDRSLIDFDLINSLPENVFISSATLSLFANTVNGGHTVTDGPNDSWIEKITEPWEEFTVTWNNQPATTTANRIALEASQSADQNYLDIDVTQLIMELYENPDDGFGLMIKLQNESQRRSLEFASSDAPDENIHPLLTIEYFEADDCVFLSSDNQDARVQSNIPNDNIAISQLFKAHSGTIGGVPFIDRSLIDFNVIDSLPDNAMITNATLSLYANTVNGGHKVTDGPNDSWLEKITEPWDPSTVTWNNQPATSEFNRVALEGSQSADQNYLNINVTDIVKDLYENPEEGFGLMMKLQNESQRRSMEFGSSDAPDPAIHPSLRICYTLINAVEDNPNEFPELKLFPNPIQDYLQAEWKAMDFEFIELVNTNGQIVFKAKIESENQAIFDVSKLVPGVYFANFVGRSTYITKKMIKL